MLSHFCWYERYLRNIISTYSVLIQRGDGHYTTLSFENGAANGPLNPTVRIYTPPKPYKPGMIDPFLYVNGMIDHLFEPCRADASR